MSVLRDPALCRCTTSLTIDKRVPTAAQGSGEHVLAPPEVTVEKTVTPLKTVENTGTPQHNNTARTGKEKSGKAVSSSMRVRRKSGANPV
jgi:hypothetical protein